jgi:hypothetical protein
MKAMAGRSSCKLIEPLDDFAVLTGFVSTGRSAVELSESACKRHIRSADACGMASSGTVEMKRLGEARIG